jgi:hypothetical protein
MENISTPAELKQAIKLLEDEQAVHLLRMKEQFSLSYERLNPVRLIEHTLKEITSSPYLVNNIWGTAIGLFTGYLSKMVVVSHSHSKIRKLFGYVLQFGVTNLVAKNPNALKSFGQYIWQRIYPEKEASSSSQ